ncbi:hypothetical protein IGI04_030632 [Brassica rapa subsp. trilocularis]|uniref:Uncharacterized protein n=2 Tax=Brassica campestris TaxID=3711 RepID=M4F1F7_BRACM|nr:hypothetical protein IGI04_030270 [Brassica rapa subsp. trilocularis]KAG5389091.1 hypothetical protein IGI04_030632 [Brassica rapa subsp. trilocularis]
MGDASNPNMAAERNEGRSFHFVRRRLDAVDLKSGKCSLSSPSLEISLTMEVSAKSPTKSASVTDNGGDETDLPITTTEIIVSRC